MRSIFPALAVLPFVLTSLAACDSTEGGSPFGNLTPVGTWDRRDSVAVALEAGTQYVVFDQTLVLSGSRSAPTGTLTTRRIDSNPVTPPRPLDNATVTGTFDGYALKLTLTHPSRTVSWNGSVGITNEFLGFTDETGRQIAFLRRQTGTTK